MNESADQDETGDIYSFPSRPKTVQGRSAWITFRPISILRLLTTSPFSVCMTGALTSAASGQSNLHTHLQTHSHFSFLTSSLNKIARRSVGAHRSHRISFKC